MEGCSFEGELLNADADADADAEGSEPCRRLEDMVDVALTLFGI